MGDYINRKAFLEHMSHTNRYFDVKFDIEEFPAANVVPVIFARWKYYSKQNIAVCTHCSFERALGVDFGSAVACPNCGARMDNDVP